MAQIRGWPGPAQCPLSLSHAGSPAEARAAAPAKTPSCDLRRLVEEQGLEGTVSATVYERPKSCQSPPWEGVGARRCLPVGTNALSFPANVWPTTDWQTLSVPSNCQIYGLEINEMQKGIFKNLQAQNCLT